jgi:hypothetical protein
MVALQFTEAADSFNNIPYNLVFSESTHDIIPLPAPALFDSFARHGYRVMPEDIIAYWNNQAAAEEEPQVWDA